MPAMQCSECSFEWDADDADEPAPDHAKDQTDESVEAETRAHGVAACDGVGAPGACASCGGESCDECADPDAKWLAHPIV